MAANDWLVLPDSEQIIDLRELFFLRRSGPHSVRLHFKNDKHCEVAVHEAQAICEHLGIEGADAMLTQQHRESDPREEYDVLDEIEVES